MSMCKKSKKKKRIVPMDAKTFVEVARKRRKKEEK